MFFLGLYENLVIVCGIISYRHLSVHLFGYIQLSLCGIYDGLGRQQQLFTLTNER